MPPRFAKLAGLGAFGANAFFIALYALIAYAAYPRPTGGIDRTQAVVTWISVGIVIVSLVALHVVLGRQLFALSRGVARDV